MQLDQLLLSLQMKWLVRGERYLPEVVLTLSKRFALYSPEGILKLLWVIGAFGLKKNIILTYRLHYKFVKKYFIWTYLEYQLIWTFLNIKINYWEQILLICKISIRPSGICLDLRLLEIFAAMDQLSKKVYKNVNWLKTLIKSLGIGLI